MWVCYNEGGVRRGRRARPPGEGEKRNVNADDRDESTGAGGRGVTPRTGATSTARGGDRGTARGQKGRNTRKGGWGARARPGVGAPARVCPDGDEGQMTCVRLRFCSGLDQILIIIMKNPAN